MHSEPSVALVLEHWAPGDHGDFCGHDDQYQEEGDDITMVVMPLSWPVAEKGDDVNHGHGDDQEQDESGVQDVTCKHQACVTFSPHARYQEDHLDRTCP